MYQSIGVLWEKHKDGQLFYSGVIRDLHGTINIAVFPNHKKEKDNQPDFNIVINIGDKKPSNGQKVESEAEDKGIPF